MLYLESCCRIDEIYSTSYLMNIQAGQQFANYEIVKMLGKGGMGEVYLAKDRRLNRQVAIKVLSDELTEDHEQSVRFRKEAALAAALTHPNICTIHETGETDGRTWICMEYIEGMNLRDFIASRSESGLSIDEVLDISIQIADALEEARKRGIVHRDVKSGNILVTPRKLVKVLDFGLAKRVQNLGDKGLSEISTTSGITQAGAIRGTVAYMSPEMALGKRVDHRSDIFSFGIVIYEMLAGRLPFVGNSVTEVVNTIINKDPPPVTRYNDKVPDALVRVLNKMLEKDVENRYQSVHEVWIDLRRIREENTKNRYISTSPLPEQIRSRSPYRMLLIIAAVLIAIFLGGFYFARKEAPLGNGAATNAPADHPSIAVLSFQYTGDPAHQYFGSLITDALTAGLQSDPEIAIAPYATVREIEREKSLKDLGRNLGVRWVVRGHVSVNGNQLKIEPELASAQGTLWKQPFQGFVDRPITTIDEVKVALLKQLNKAGDSSAKAIEQLRTPMVNAYKDYLDARNLLEQWDVGENLDEAVTLYRKAVSADPDFAAAHAGLAIALVRQYFKVRTPSLLVSANDEAKKAVALDASLPESLIADGLIELERGNSVEAKVNFNRALELSPGNDEACRYIASFYEEHGRKEDAKKMYELAISLRPGLWVNYYAFGKFEAFRQKDLRAAKTQLMKASELNPQGSAPLVMLGIVELLQGQLENAAVYLGKSITRGADNVYTRGNLGLVYYYRGQYDLAVRNWQEVLHEAPDHPLYQANIGDALRQLGDRKSAEDYYNKAIKGFRVALAANPEDDTSRAGMAMALSALGRCDEAKEETRNVLSRSNQSSELKPYAAVTAARCGDVKWAAQISLDAIADKNILDIRYHPDLESVRQIPEVRRALQQAGVPIT
jgi:serine/threonine protein kinase/tetratricopeptide (TPR) repeat protein